MKRKGKNYELNLADKQEFQHHAVYGNFSG